MQNIIDLNKILLYEPSLSKIMEEAEINRRINEGYSSLILDLKKEGKKVRQYAIPLILYKSNNGLNIETDYIEDTIERTAILIKCSGNGILEIIGKNVIGEEKVILSIPVVNEINQIDYLLETFKWYKVKFTGNFQELEVKLIEAGFYKALIYKVLSIIFMGLSINYEDTYKEKADYYNEQYKNEFAYMVVSYDNDDDGTPDETGNSNYNIGLIDLMR